MQLNKDTKQSKNVYLSRKANNQNSLDLTFNNSNWLHPDPKSIYLPCLRDVSSFNKHIQSEIKKCYKIKDVMKKLSSHLLHLAKIYKSFVSPNMNYCDII